MNSLSRTTRIASNGTALEKFASKYSLSMKYNTLINDKH
jgi:hypothetical protein